MKEKRLLKLHDYSTKINEDNFLSLLERDPSAVMIDLGCGDGNFTIKCAKEVGTNKLWSVEIVEEYVRKAGEKGIRVIKADLNTKLPVESDFFDVVVSNQLIEHLIDTYVFVKEIYRILKYKGYAIISTENLSSWHNIYALLLGYRLFSLDYS